MFRFLLSSWTGYSWIAALCHHYQHHQCYGEIPMFGKVNFYVAIRCCSRRIGSLPITSSALNFWSSAGLLLPFCHQSLPGSGETINCAHSESFCCLPWVDRVERWNILDDPQTGNAVCWSNSVGTFGFDLIGSLDHPVLWAPGFPLNHPSEVS